MHFLLILSFCKVCTALIPLHSLIMSLLTGCVSLASSPAGAGHTLAITLTHGPHTTLSQPKPKLLLKTTIVHLSLPFSFSWGYWCLKSHRESWWVEVDGTQGDAQETGFLTPEKSPEGESNSCLQLPNRASQIGWSQTPKHAL